MSDKFNGEKLLSKGYILRKGETRNSCRFRVGKPE